MESFYLHLSIFLIAALILNDAEVKAQTSAIITQVQTVSNGVSSSKLIECAFHLMKSSDMSFVRIAEGSYVCEQLARPTSSYSDFFENGFEYIEKSTLLNSFDEQSNFKEKVEHYVYKTVTINDKFRFVIKKSNIDKIEIIFKDDHTNTFILDFFDTATALWINDKVDGKYGTKESQQYPFSNFKTYTILFEALDTQWKIYIDDIFFTTFQHRHSIATIQKVSVRTGQQVTYLSKAFQPRI